MLLVAPYPYAPVLLDQPLGTALLVVLEIELVEKSRHVLLDCQQLVQILRLGIASLAHLLHSVVAVALAWASQEADEACCDCLL